MNIEVSYDSSKNYGVQECLKALVHASTCSLKYLTSLCRSNLPCNKMTRLIKHAKTCSYEYPMSLCNLCKNYISLCVRHARGCQENRCSVLLCEKINRRQQEQHVLEQQQSQNQETAKEPSRNEMDQYIQPPVSQKIFLKKRPILKMAVSQVGQNI